MSAVRPQMVAHLVLNVRDVEASTRFYTEVLGFQVATKRKDGSGAFLTCGEKHHDLALFKAPEGADPVKEGSLGLNHFAIQVANFDALKEAHRALKEKGVKIQQTTDHAITGSMYFFDPDGNRVELFYNMQDSVADGLAVMRTPGRKIKELVME